MGRRRGSGKIRSRDKEVGTGEVPQMDKGIWEEAVGKDAYKKVVGSCDRCERGVCAKEGEGVSAVKGRKGRGERICEGTVAERIYPAVQVTTNSASVFVGKKDGKKRIVQDYRYLNEWTIKNNYPLLLISDVLENIGTKKVFTKMDLQ